jgi:arginyl-tRNA--protein-N-Asp/Glu arginylyltransferase
LRLAFTVAPRLHLPAAHRPVKLIFSEAKPDYAHYLFPYAIWALPEPGESPSDLFRAGFLPASRNLDRFYLCRHVRIDLRGFAVSSENRRILRKGAKIRFEVVPRSQFDFTPARRQSWKHYADIKFGKDVMSLQRLDGLMESRMISHLMVFQDTATGAEIGTVTLFVDRLETAFYYYAFYDLNYYERNLGMFMMTTAVSHFALEQCRHVYLGTVYSKNALYKTQFAGAEFFNGFEWSSDITQLKHLLQRDTQVQHSHLLESPEFMDQFYPGGLEEIAARPGN